MKAMPNEGNGWRCCGCEAIVLVENCAAVQLMQVDGVGLTLNAMRGVVAYPIELANA